VTNENRLIWRLFWLGLTGSSHGFWQTGQIPPVWAYNPGKRGELRQHFREGQEDQLGALGLVLNMIVLWNTSYMEAALNQLRADGFEVRDEDVARLSPLLHEHINMLGRYSFSVPDAVAKGELRPLRNPASDE